MVFTPMESSPSSKLRFLDETGKEIPLPVEGSNCCIAVDVPKENWSDISLQCGIHKLEVLFDRDFAYCHWPICGPGHYELYLVCRDYRERRKVTLMPRYFTEREISSMLEDLTEILPKSIASQLIESGVHLGTLEQKPTVEDEYLELRRAIAGTDDRLGLLQILPVIQRECHHVLTTRTELRDSNQLRRPDISKLPGIMAMPGNVLSPDLVFQMYDMTVERSFDTYENRLVKAYVEALRGRLSRLQDKKDQVPPSVAAEIETLVNDFNLACVRATFLRQVRLPTVFTGRVTMVLLKNPTYRIIFEDYLALNKQSSVILEEAALNDPLNQFPFLYELWINLTVLNAMLQVCVEAGFRCVSHKWIKKYKRGIFIQMTNDEKAAIEFMCPDTGRQAALVPWRPDHGNEILEDTANRERLIALALLIDTPGKQPQILVFDPEYRVGAKGIDEAKEKIGADAETEKARSHIEPMKEDVADLLRWVDLSKTSESARAMPYAAILYPGPGLRFSSEVEALTAVPSQRDALQKAVSGVLRSYLA